MIARTNKEKILTYIFHVIVIVNLMKFQNFIQIKSGIKLTVNVTVKIH